MDSHAQTTSSPTLLQLRDAARARRRQEVYEETRKQLRRALGELIPGHKVILFGSLIPKELKNPVEELKGFRHVFVHAYELELDPEKLALLLKYAERVAREFPALPEALIEQVKRQQGLDKAP